MDPFVGKRSRNAKKEFQKYKMQLHKSLNSMVQPDSVQLLPLMGAVVLSVIMVFSTWTITDRSYLNIVDNNNLTPNEVLLFGL